MIDQNEKKNNLERLWMHDGVWYRSGFARKFLKRARAQYPTPQDGTKAAWPADEEGIAQNLTYFFTGHMLKMNKILSSILADEESMSTWRAEPEWPVLRLSTSFKKSSAMGLFSAKRHWC